MRIEMRVNISYFTMDGKFIERVKISPEDLPENVRFPGDVTSYIQKMKKAGNLPGKKFRGIDFHILVSVVTSEVIYSRLIINLKGLKNG